MRAARARYAALADIEKIMRMTPQIEFVKKERVRLLKKKFKKKLIRGDTRKR